MNGFILLVEDNHEVAQPLKDLLEELDYAVLDIVNSGEKTLDVLKKIKPDLILMDIMLSGELDGIQTAQLIKDTYDIPIVFSTGYTDAELLERAKITHPFGYILKPYQRRELRVIIEVAMHNYKIEKAIRDSETRFRMLTMNSSDITTVIDHKGHIMFNSTAAEKIMGYDPNKSGSSIFEFVHPEDAKKAQEIIDNLLDFPTNSQRGELRIQHRDGSWRILEVIANNMLREPAIRGIIINSRDVTDRILAEKAKNIAQDERNKSALAIAVTASHEINQPLMVLKANLEMLEMNLPDGSFKGHNSKYIEKIDSSIDRIQETLSRIKEAQSVRFANYSDDTEMIVFDTDD